MIILTIKKGSQTETRAFPKKSILFGAAGSPQIDVAIDESGVGTAHLRIIEEDDRYLIENIPNDPFATLNDLPFGRKTLKNRDMIQVGGTTIIFEGKTEVPSSSPLHQELMYDTSTELVGIVGRSIQGNQQKTQPSPTTTVVKENHNIDALIEEVEMLDSEGSLSHAETIVPKKAEPTPHKKETPAKPVRPEIKTSSPPQTYVPASTRQNEKRRPIEVHDYQSDEPEPPLEQTIETTPQKRSFLRKPLVWIAILCLLFSLIAVISSGVYTRLEKKAALQEIKAASGVADVALALTYAQINGIKAPQQNWTDPDFLNSSISSVLSKQHHSIGEVDHHGHILNTEYMLRIYVNRDMTRFLIIAQPEPSLTQWLVPKSSIILDSLKMELRKSDDLKSLNRLLVNPSALNAEGGNSVITQVNSGEVIPLASLADRTNQNGFAPPKALQHVRPGAENLIYNAPRYSQVGEQIMQDAVAIVNNQGNAVELRRLQDQLKIIARLPNVVLYTSKGLKSALIGKKALEKLTPQNKYLIAYFRYDANKGTTSHLIMDESASKDKQDEISLVDIPKANSSTILLPQKPQEPTPSPTNAFDNSVDTKSPIYTNIASLQKERTAALLPLSQNIIELLQKQNEDTVPNFSERIHLLLKDYEAEADRQQNLINEKLKKIYQENEGMSLSDFSSYIKAAGLKGVAESRLQHVESKPSTQAISYEEFQAYLTKIEQSLGFSSLLESTTGVARLLNLENIPDPNHLARYQNRTRAQTLERLNEFLLSPYSPLSTYDFTQANRALLMEIMKSAWISDPEEQRFYLSEFDHHAANF